jgi:hypothetical protein
MTGDGGTSLQSSTCLALWRLDSRLRGNDGEGAGLTEGAHACTNAQTHARTHARTKAQKKPGPHGPGLFRAAIWRSMHMNYETVQPFETENLK